MLPTRLETMKSCLEESRLSRAEELRPRLAELRKVQVEQREEGEGVTAQTLALVQQYNDIIHTLTEAFIQVRQLIYTAKKLGFS